MHGTAASIVAQTNRGSNAYNAGIISDLSGSIQLGDFSAGSLARTYNGTNAFNVAPGSGDYTGLMKTGLAWDASTRSLVANNGTVATGAGGAAFGATVIIGGQNGVAAASQYYPDIKIWNSRLSDPTIQLATQ